MLDGRGKQHDIEENADNSQHTQRVNPHLGLGQTHGEEHVQGVLVHDGQTKLTDMSLMFLFIVFLH